MPNPPHRFDSDRAKAAAQRSAEVRRERAAERKRQKAEQKEAGAEAQALAAQGHGGDEELRSVLRALALDAAQPGAVRVQAARAALSDDPDDATTPGLPPSVWRSLSRDRRHYLLAHDPPPVTLDDALDVLLDRALTEGVPGRMDAGDSA